MGKEDTEDSTSWSTPGAHGTDGTRKRRTSGKKEDTKSHESNSTREDADAIKNIRQCKNYYEILGVPQDCNEEDLKKAYKKLALKYHPDKNQTAGATEAFKAISNAFSVLNDPEKRQRYDQYGSEEEQSHVGRHHHSEDEYDYTRGFQGDISAEELFNIFFGSGFQMAGGPRVRTYYRPARTQYRYQRYQQQNQTADEDGIGLHRLLPLLIIVVIMMLTNLLRNDPYYNLQHTSKYNTQRSTSNLGVNYYVKPDFTDTFKGSIHKLEAQVEDEYVTNLRSNCYKERMYRESLLWQARSYQSSRMYEEAQKTGTPSCDRLQDIYGG